MKGWGVSVTILHMRGKQPPPTQVLRTLPSSPPVTTTPNSRSRRTQLMAPSCKPEEAGRGGPRGRRKMEEGADTPPGGPERSMEGSALMPPAWGGHAAMKAGDDRKDAGVVASIEGESRPMAGERMERGPPCSSTTAEAASDDAAPATVSCARVGTFVFICCSGCARPMGVLIMPPSHSSR